MDIGTVDGWIVVVLTKGTVSLSVFYVGYLMLFIKRYLQKSGEKSIDKILI